MIYPRIVLLNWLALLLGLALMWTCEAHAQGYIEGFGGLTLPSLVQDHAYDVSMAPVSPHGLNRYSVPGAVLGIRAGAYQGMWGFEVEAMHQQPNIKQEFIESCDQQPNGDCLNGRRSLMAGRMHSVNTVAIHALMRYEGKRWEPFVGFGPMYAMSKLGGDACGWKPPQCGTVLSPYTDSTRKADAFGLSAKVGTLYKLSSDWGLTMTYGFQWARFSYDGWVPQADATGHAETLNYYNQSITLGVRYAFR